MNEYNDDHDCTGHISPVIDSYDSEVGEPVLSATLGGGDVEVYAECSVCGRGFTMNYEYVSTDPDA